jgi:predicted dienelactone hydrolase/cyclophilin family peptidyl-prolyl cis-trans isomerase
MLLPEMYMLLIDVVALTTLCAAVVAWWFRGAPWAARSLIPLAVVALVTAIAGVLDQRWQLAPAALVALPLLTIAVFGRRWRTGQIRPPWITGSLLSLLLLPAIALPYLHPVADLPPPSGPHPVGVRDFALTDESRTGLLAAPEGSPRRLLVRVWYPAESTAGLSPRPYFSDLEARTTATGLGTLVGLPFYFTYVKHVLTNSFENAPLMAEAGQLPVVFYSHGYTSFAGQNTVLMEELASHGYVVYSLQHPYDSSPTVFPDGTVIDIDPALLDEVRELAEADSGDFVDGFIAPTYSERYSALLASRVTAIEEGQRISTLSADIWLADRLFVHDALMGGAVPDEVSAIVEAGDLSGTGEMGMSFGGSTAGAVCMIDRRCVAGVNLDGGDYHYQPFNANVPVPFMMFYSDFHKLYEQLGGDPEAGAHGFNDFSYERHEVAGVRDDVVRLSVRDVAHLGVSDFTLFMRNPVRALLLGAVDGETMVQIQNDFVRGFFDSYLKGDGPAGAGPIFPAAQFAAYSNQVSREPVDGVREWWLEAHPEDRVVRVIFETSMGDVEVALYPERAPVSVANFLAYVDGGHYDGASVYRALKNSGPYGYGVIQGGLLRDTMSGDGAEYAAPARVLPPIAHEPTTRTGIPNERGTLAYARLTPGSAGSEFFFNLTDNAVLDTGAEVPGRDGQGYATFGRVLRGLPILDQIQTLPADGLTQMERLQGQILTKPVRIHRVYRVNARG